MIETIKIEDHEFRRAMSIYAADSKRSAAELLRQQASLFLKDAVSVTPPGGKGGSGQSAKKRGERIVARDILRLMQPWVPPSVPADVLRAAGMFVEEASTQSPADIHKANRSPTGRVNRKLNPRIKIKAADLKRYIVSKQKMVGVLASGWNASAERLGFRTPGWIARHGTGGGRCQVELSGSDMRIVVTNSVRFVGKVGDLERRVAFALYRRTKALLRQIDHFQQQAARKAGL